MKKFNVVVSSVLCAVMMGSLFSGCGNEAGSKPGSTASAKTGDKKEAPMKIKMVNRLDTNYVMDNNPIIKKMEELNNIKIDLEIPPQANYNDRINIIMASGDLPDLLYIWNLDNKYASFAKEGILLPVDEYLSDAPNIAAKATKEQLQAAFVPDTGKLHAVARPHAGNNFGALIRKDWLDKLGLQMPNTVEEFKAVAKAFTEKDPDGNGKNDTYGVLIKADTVSALTDASVTGVFGVRPLMMQDKNGKIVIPEADGSYMKFLDFYRELYAMKAMDQEFYLNKGNAARDKWKQGKGGILIDVMKSNELFATNTTDLTKANPQAKVDFLFPLKNPEDGKRYSYQTTSVWGGYAITRAAKDPKRIMKFIDWGFSDEGITVTTAGVKGVTYEELDLKTGKLTSTPEQDALRAKSAGWFNFITSVKGIRILNSGKTDEERALYTKHETNFLKDVNIIENIPENIVPGVVDERNKLVDLDKTKLELSVKYIAGQGTKEEVEKFLKDKYVPANKTLMELAQKFHDANKGKK